MPPQKRHKGRGGAYHGRDGRQPQRDAESAPLNDIPANATVQAFEAQLVYGRSERFHELFDVSGGTEAGPSRARGALVRLQIEDQVDGDTPGRELWVDRYDILHLLPSVPLPRSNVEDGGQSAQPSGSSSHRRSPSPASSSSSWDSVPSDAEDTWYLSGDEEFDEYERAKKRRWMEALREERIRERDKEERERVLPGSGAWAGADEEPPPAVLTLMSHTAASLASSPNPSLLEIRIMAHHATDDRFSFLKGRYKATWERAKAEARKEKAMAAQAAAAAGGGLGTLMGGYDSDSDDDSRNDGSRNGGVKPEDQEPEGSPPPSPPSPPGESPPLPDSPREAMDATREMTPPRTEQDLSVLQRERKQRLEEWKRKRKADDEAA